MRGVKLGSPPALELGLYFLEPKKRPTWCLPKPGWSGCQGQSLLSPHSPVQSPGPFSWNRAEREPLGVCTGLSGQQSHNCCLGWHLGPRGPPNCFVE